LLLTNSSWRLLRGLIEKLQILMDFFGKIF